MSIVTKTILIHNGLSLGKYKAHNLFKNSPTCKNKNKYKQTNKETKFTKLLGTEYVSKGVLAKQIHYNVPLNIKIPEYI